MFIIDLPPDEKSSHYSTTQKMKIQNDLFGMKRLRDQSNFIFLQSKGSVISLHRERNKDFGLLSEKELVHSFRLSSIVEICILFIIPFNVEKWLILNQKLSSFVTFGEFQ
jgi:hypothetical protein